MTDAAVTLTPTRVGLFVVLLGLAGLVGIATVVMFT